MFRPNQQLGSYFLIQRLGKGAFGEVWLAEERTILTVHKVALKFPNLEDVDLEIIRQEATVWETVKGHPNILPIIKADIVDDQIYIASEYAPDGSLNEWLKNNNGRAPTIENAVEMTRGILSGLAHLHSRDIIHRDLKPSNILLQSEMPRLADFGLARVLKSSGASSNVSGTYAYMPPEAFDGIRSKQTDIWSAGVIFYQLLSGSLPYPQPEITAMIAAILLGQPKPLPDTIPSELSEIVSKALKKQSERWQSALEMRDALAKYNQHQPDVIPETISLPKSNNPWPYPANVEENAATRVRPANSPGDAPTEEIKYSGARYEGPFAGGVQLSQPGIPPRQTNLAIWVAAAIGGAFLILLIGFGITFYVASFGTSSGVNNSVNKYQVKSSPGYGNNLVASTPKPTSTPTPLRTPEPSSYDIPLISANVTELKLYERSKDPLPLGQRVYKTTFDKDNTRYVCYELNLAHPYSAPAKQNFSVEDFWFRGNALVLRNTLKTYIDEAWNSSAHTSCYGYPDYGRWTSYLGSHKLEIKYEGKVIASKDFKVE